jgi:hypothetical protein
VNEFKRCLIDLDTEAAIRLWPSVFPHSPLPSGHEEILLVLHFARTKTEALAFRLRAYSHSWLCERGLPSALPDNLRPKADRLYPRIVEAVGVSVKDLSGRRQEYARRLERAMADAVAEAYADGRRDPEFVRSRMQEAREQFERVA